MKKDTKSKKNNGVKKQTLLNEGKQNVDLNSPGIAKALSKRIAEDIDEYCVKAYDGGHRWHLGGSQIGEECSRKLWGVFRWLLQEKFDGRMQRLFNRGHKEEDRFIEWLEGIGAQVWADDLENNTLYYVEETNSYFLNKSDVEVENELAIDVSNDKVHIKRAKADGVEFPQYRITAVNGHFGGSLDAIIILPPRYNIKEPILGEFKTNGTGAGFNKLLKDGMVVAKPQHFAQTSTYGGEYKFNYVLYMNICKNDDNIHIEVIKLNHSLGEQMKLKAEKIITSQTPPPRISDNPTFFQCKWCNQSEICHKGAMPEVNCRSCLFAKPAENSEWFCETHNGTIPREFVPDACPKYKAITQNV